jgi:hypothetical protein
MKYKNHRFYNEFQQLRYDDKDFECLYKDTKKDFLEWVDNYELEAYKILSNWIG